MSIKESVHAQSVGKSQENPIEEAHEGFESPEKEMQYNQSLSNEAAD